MKQKNYNKITSTLVGILVGILLAFASTPLIAQTCAYWQQKAQESRAAAARERAIAPNSGQSQYHLQTARAHDNAAAQYDMKASTCSSGSVTYGTPSNNSKADTLGNAVQGIGNLLMNLSRQKEEKEAREAEAADQQAEREARQAEVRARRADQERIAAQGRMNDKIAAEMARQNLNDKIAEQMKKDANPRLVDPDCSIAAWMVKESRGNMQMMDALHRLSKGTMKPDADADVKSDADKALSSVKTAEKNYQSCMNSPAAPVNGHKSETPTYQEFTKASGQISVKNGVVSSVRPVTNDPKIQAYFQERLKAIRALYGQQPDNASTGKSPLYFPPKAPLDDNDAKIIAPTNQYFAQAIAMVPSPFYVVKITPPSSPSTSNVLASNAINSTLDDDATPNQEVSLTSLIREARGWANEKILAPVQRRFDSVCGVERIETGNTDLDDSFEQVQRDISPCTLFRKTYPFRGGEARGGLVDYSNQNNENMRRQQNEVRRANQ